MKHVAVVATHHKTGTVWMRTVFQRIARDLNLKFTFVETLQGTKPSALVVPSIIFADHSTFRQCRWILKHPETRLFHLIRDPRDVVVSAMHYHRIAVEPWLHKPWKSFDGLTYQEMINGLPDDHARYCFEMKNSARNTIRAMQKWNYKRKRSFECKYEDLIVDYEMTKFTEILLHLGFSDKEIQVCRDIFEEKSLFGSKSKDGHSHIRSGEGRQWKRTFNFELAQEFMAQFGDVLIDLGYETDNAWVNEFAPGEDLRPNRDLSVSGR